MAQQDLLRKVVEVLEFQDALHVYEVQAGSLDLEYIARWAEVLGVDREWKRIQDAAELL